MKLYLFSFFLFLQFSSLVFAQKVSFNVQYSEKFAVYIFVKNLSGKFGNNSFKKEFQKSKFHEKKYLDLLAQFEYLKIDYLYSFSDFPYGVKLPMITETALQKHLISAISLQDFKIKAMGLITNEDLTLLTDILVSFTPVYNELIYKPNQIKFEANLKAFSNFLNSQKTNLFFERGLQFYQSVWDKSIPFELVFYPLPSDDGFTAGAFNNYLISAFPINYDNQNDYTVLLGIMMHEGFHILYDEQPLQVKKNIQFYFNENPSTFSQYAYLLFNEVLATAIGNGFIYEEIKGKHYTEEWYFFPYINQMAKKIYPIVQKYLKENRAIDKAFIDAYVQVYEHNFKHWLNDPIHTFTYRYVLSNNQQDFDIVSRFFPYCSAMETEDIINDSNIKKMKNTPITKIIIVSKDHYSQLSLIKNAFPELNKWNFNAEQEFSHSLFLKDKTKLYIFNQHQTTTEKWLEKLK